jgi:hypothetical protein
VTPLGFIADVVVNDLHRVGFCEIPATSLRWMQHLLPLNEGDDGKAQVERWAKAHRWAVEWTANGVVLRGEEKPPRAPQ